MRKIYLLLFTVFTAAISNSQNIANYVFTPTSGTYTPLIGGTTVPSLAGDDVNSATTIPLGFSFYYMGIPYTSVTANSNGWLSFNATPTTSTVDMRTNNLATAVTGIHPLLAPVWDDLDGRPAVIPTPVASYLTTGAVGTRVFTFEWLNWGRFAATTPSLSFQVILYEATGVIEFVYRQEVNVTNFTSATAGISNSSTSFASLSNLSAAPTISNVTSTNTITARPATGQKYAFTPPIINGGPANLTFTAVGTGGMTLNWTDGATNESAYFIYRSVDGINYSLVSALAANSTSSVQTGLSPSTLYFWRVVAATEGSVSAPASGSETTLSCGAPLPAGTYTVGPTGTYPSLTNALSVINNGTAGPVILELQNTYLSAVETFPLVIAQTTCPSGNLTIRPQTGAAGLLITSNNATTTIDFDGGDNVTVDGRPGGLGTVSQLSVINTGAGTASAVRFMNDATNNTLTYLGLQSTTAATNGVVLFAGGLVSGNDNNTVSNNTIGAAGAITPLNGVISLGTSATINNSGNTVSGNNIADVFIATAVYNGINIGTGNDAWTISNNRVYQTLPRTVTTSNTVTGITVTSGAGHTISGNVIGYSAAAGTGVMALTSTVAFRYMGINGTFTAGGTNSTIANNTIAGITMTTSSGATTTNGILAGINVTAGNATISGNTIGANTGTNSLTATSTTSGGLLVGINSSSSGTISITNNTLGALSSSGTTATIAGSVTGINVSGAAASMTITGNTIGNATADNMRGGTSGLTTGSSLVTGINAPSTSTVASYVFNTVQNLTSYGTGTTGFVRGIQTAASGTTTAATIGNNTVTMLTSNNANVSFSNGQLGAVGIYFAAGLNATISDNSISNISLTNTTTTGTNAAGISVAAASGTTLIRNKICDISNASTSTSATLPGTVSGIFVRGQATGTSLSFINNMISLGAGQSTNTAFIGIWSANSNNNSFNNNIYFNTVNITGTATLGAQPSFAFLRGDLSATARTHTVDVRNNIFHNARTSSGAGTGKHFAIGNNYGATVSTTGWGANASNYNVLNSANPATVGHWTTDQTFTGWKTASNSDLNSFSAIPVTFVGPCDLHLNMGVTPTQIESAGQPIAAITTDFDGQFRPGPAGSVNGGALGPDIGADEFDGVILDLTGPAISYTAFTNTLCSANRTLTATVLDISGVNSAPGTRPRLWYKKSTNANVLPATNDNTTDGWKWVEASNAVNPFSFTLDANKVFGSVAGGDIIQYFVVAQDLAAVPNVGINSGIFTGTPSSVALGAGNFPITGTINSYAVVAGGLSGTVTIGAAGTYPTLTGVGGLFAAINASGLTSNLTANILDASVTEPGTNALNQMLYGCAGPHNLLIKPGSGVTSTLTGALNSAALIKILSSNVTIDGSNNGTTTRDLTLANTSTTGPSVLLIGSTGTVPVVNTALKNSIVINGISSASAVVVSDAALGTAGYFNNITIQNNSVQRAYIGVYSITVPQAGNGTGLLVTGNELNTAGANSIRLTGLYFQGIDGATVTNNTIGNIANTVDATNVTGIWFATSVMNSTISGNTINGMSTTSGAPRGIVNSTGLTIANSTITGNTVTGLTTTSTGTTTGIYVFGTTGDVDVTKNMISNIKNTNATGFGANGIQLASTLSASDIDVNNNFISDVAGSGFNGIGLGDNGYGIIVTAGSGYDIDFNTVNMNTDQTSTAGLPAAINITSGVTAAGGLNIRNNIFANNQTIGVNRYAIISGAANTVFGVIDYNDYYTAAPNLGLIGALDRATLADIQTGFGGNLNSTSVMPIFVSATNLHLSNALGANWCLNGTATPLPGVLTDIDNQTRSTGIPPNGPDMGADEFTAVGDAVATPSSQTICSGATITTIVLSGSATSYNWTRNNAGTVTGIAASGTGNISGALTNITNAPITVTFTITPVIGNCNGPAITATVLVNPMPNAVATPAAQTICSGATITTIALTGNVGGTIYNWTRDNTVSVTGIAASGAGDISGALTNTTNAPVTVTFTITPTANGCAGTPVTATVLVNPIPNAIATPASQTSCSGTAITSITLTGNVPGTIFNWTRDNVATAPGISASGSGNISGTLTNTTANPVLVTFTIIPTANGCPGTAITATITVYPLPIISGTITQPTTCVSSDGAISVTLSGYLGTGFSINWTGPGVNPVSLSQTNLGVGIYTLTVSVVPGGCSTTSTFNLTGPGGCSICPTIGSVATNPSTSTCQDQATTITASGLSGMGVTYGIQFKRSTSALADPYVGGTTIATVPNGSLTGGGSAATTSTSFATPGSYFVYAILSPTPLDPACRPSAVVNLLVNPTPNAVATPSSQTICSGASITTIALTGIVAGTTFNWTRDQTVAVTGIAASGSGNIIGALMNTTTAPVIVTFTIAPTANGCPGSAITATVTVNPIPTVNTVINQTVCNGASTAAIAFSGAVAGTVYNWTNNTASIGLAASGTGNIPSFAATNTGTTAVTATVTVTPTYTNAGTTCTGTPTTFTITVNPTPTVNAVANQTVCNGASTTAIVFSGAPAGTVFNWTNSFNGIGLASSGTGNIGAFLGINTGNSPVTSTITVTPSFTVSGTTCTGTPITFTITVNPIPTVNVIPNMVVCPGSNTTQATAPVGPVVGTVFNWTNSNPAIGLAASGIGIIPAFTAVNTGVNPVTATITITPSYTNNGVTCTGPTRTFTITVNSVPTITCPANITVNNGANLCGAIVTYPNATFTGTPAPQVTYSIPSGSQFPVGLTTVTVTANNSCGTATCSFTIRVNDTQAPAIFCPGNMTTTTPVGSCTAQVIYGVSALDNCGPVVITRTAGPASGSQFPLGTTTITHVATDVAGNTSTCSFTVTVFDGQLPVIFAQPSNRTVCQGTNATFTVAAGNIVSYQWQQWNGTAFVNIAGATASTYTVTNATNAMNTSTFRVVLNGLCTVFTSGNATLFVNNPASVALAAVPPASLTPGFSTMLVATPSTGGGTYQWFRNGQLIANTASTLGPLTVDNQATYRVVYTDANGCIATSADLVVSAMLTSKLWVYPNPNRGQFQVRYFNAQNDVAYIMIHDALGRKVHHQEASNGNPYSVMNVDLGFTANGIYIVSLVNGAGKIVGSVRIVVQKFQ